MNQYFLLVRKIVFNSKIISQKNKVTLKIKIKNLNYSDLFFILNNTNINKLFLNRLSDKLGYSVHYKQLTIIIE